MVCKPTENNLLLHSGSAAVFKDQASKDTLGIPECRLAADVLTEANAKLCQLLVHAASRFWTETGIIKANLHSPCGITRNRPHLIHCCFAANPRVKPAIEDIHGQPLKQRLKQFPIISCFCLVTNYSSLKKRTFQIKTSKS